ncbi:hypothetical protein ABWL39_01365 [Chitinivorax sp. PXF-14]|uniref:hypothetical protein n=1 Tax=Chitinivorax sp. PXF-14 TaxID=3230488 RepID=UPI003467906A
MAFKLNPLGIRKYKTPGNGYEPGYPSTTRTTHRLVHLRMGINSNAAKIAHDFHFVKDSRRHACRKTRYPAYS